MLNRYCSQNELEKTLTKEDFSNIDYVLERMLPPDTYKSRPIYHNLKILGEIHHAVNLGKYASKKFRTMLYESSKEDAKGMWDRYFAQCGVDTPIEIMSERNHNAAIEKCVRFKWGKNKETKEFVRFFKYPDYIIPDEREDYKVKTKIFGDDGKFEPLKFLLDYQSSTVSKVLKKLSTLNAFCLLQMPTGTGKTRTAMEIVARLFNMEEDIQVVWFANKSELLGQAYESFMHVWRHVGKFPVTAVVAWGSRNIPKISERKSIVFAGYQKMQNFEDEDWLSPNYIVVDEAHQVLAPTYKKQLYRLSRKKHARVLGLTATPGRGIDERQNMKLADLFHKNIVQIELHGEDRQTYENNIVRYLEDQGILAKAEFDPLETGARYDLTEKEWMQLTKIMQVDRPELTPETLRKLSNDNLRNIEIIKKLKELADHGKKILYFGTSVSQSILVFVVLQQLGINAIHVDKQTDHSFRRQIIRKFIETDEIQVICNDNIFSTGFDVPKLDVVFIGRPVMSPVLFNQMVGRGTRGSAVGGKESFLLVQVIDDIRHGTSEFDPYEQYGYWDKNWHSNDG